MPAGKTATRIVETFKRGFASQAIAVLGSAALLSSCAASTPIALESTGSADLAGRTMALATDADADDTGTRAVYAEAIRSALAARGMAMSPDAPLLADFAMSVSDAKRGLVLQDPGEAEAASDQDDIGWESEPRNRRLFQACSPQRLRATLVVLDRASGDIAYRGEAVKLECSPSDGTVAALADALAQDFTRRR